MSHDTGNDSATTPGSSGSAEHIRAAGPAGTRQPLQSILLRVADQQPVLPCLIPNFSPFLRSYQSPSIVLHSSPLIIAYHGRCHSLWWSPERGLRVSRDLFSTTASGLMPQMSEVARYEPHRRRAGYISGKINTTLIGFRMSLSCDQAMPQCKQCGVFGNSVNDPCGLCRSKGMSLFRWYLKPSELIPI